MVQLDDAASGQNFVDLKLCTACQSTDFCASFAHIATGKLDSKNWSYSLAFWWDDHESQGNWTWTPFTKLAWKWYFYSSKLTGVSSDRVTPGPSRDTLMGLRCIHWVLQQNLRIQRQAPEQKLCHKASWFYGIVTSRPFTYRELSIAARSSGASLNRIVELRFSSSWYLEPNETWHVIFVGFQLCLNWFGAINKHSHQRLSRVSDSSKFSMSVYMILGSHIFVCMQKRKMYVCEHGNAKACTCVNDVSIVNIDLMFEYLIFQYMYTVCM